MQNIRYLPGSCIYVVEGKLDDIEIIPIRQEIEVLGPDIMGIIEYGDFDHDAVIITSKKKIGMKSVIRKLKLRWSMSEKIRIGVINPRAISKVRLNSE